MGIRQMPDPAIHETRQRLLAGGVTYLSTHGYHGSGLKGILSAVGIPKGSFYYYFNSKDAYTAAVIDYYISPYLDRLQVLGSASGESGKSRLLTYFSELMAASAASEYAGGCLLGNLMGELDASRNPSSRKALSMAMASYADALACLIAIGQADGSIRSDIEAGALADLLVNQWQGALLRAKLERSAGPLNGCIAGLIEGYFKPHSRSI